MRWKEWILFSFDIHDSLFDIGNFLQGNYVIGRGLFGRKEKVWGTIRQLFELVLCEGTSYTLGCDGSFPRQVHEPSVDLVERHAWFDCSRG